MSVLCLAAALTGCSDDGSKADAKPDGDKSSAAQPENTTRDCTVDVEVTGAVQASWSGKASSATMTSGPAAVYRAVKGDTQLAVYAKGDDFPASANVTQGQRTFTTPQGDGNGVTAKGSGASAKVDAEASGIKPGQSVHLTADFTC